MRLVAASREIRNPRSPVGKFFRTVFPHVNDVVRDADAFPSDKTTLRPAGTG